MPRMIVGVPIVSIDIMRAYTTLDIPDGLTKEEQQAYALEAWRNEGGSWETEYVIDVNSEYLGDSTLAQVRGKRGQHTIEIDPDE